LKIQFFSDVSEEIGASNVRVVQDELSTLMCSKLLRSICDYTPIYTVSYSRRHDFFHQHCCERLKYCTHINSLSEGKSKSSSACHEATWEIGGIRPLILKLSTRWRWFVSFVHWLPYSQGNMLIPHWAVCWVGTREVL